MLADPYPVYHRLRAMHPVFWAPPLEAWVVTSYEAVSASLRNPEFSPTASTASNNDWPQEPRRHARPRFRSMIHMDRRTIPGCAAS